MLLNRVQDVGYDFDAVPKERVETCNLCGSADFTAIARRDRYGFAATTVACTRCGLAFLNPRLTAAAYADFYRGVYRPLVSAYHGRRIDAETVEADQVPYAEELAALLEPHLRGRGYRDLLDVGGSTGVVSEAIARRFELAATVFDPAPAEVERARARGLDAEVATIETFDPGERRYDVVLLCQTIDHLTDIAAALAQIRTWLRDGGVFFVDIVDFRWAYAHNGVEQATKIDHPHSLTEPTAEAFLARAGFDVSQKRRAADLLHVAYVCRAAQPVPEALPPRETVERLLAETGAAA